MSICNGVGMAGPEVIRRVAGYQQNTILAFSAGKDAVAAWLAIRPHFESVTPYYLYLVPGLDFVEESLDYYERYFGQKIIRLPHPSLYRMLNGLIFQPPERCRVIEQAKLPLFEYSDIQQVVCEDSGLPTDTLVADGVRAADSPMRRVSIKRYGAISTKNKKYHPVWDMKKADLIALFRGHKVKLSRDYEIFGRSFDGIDLRFLVGIKKHYPSDYKKILDWFPLAELEIFRYERASA